jgi:hypothetical protein
VFGQERGNERVLVSFRHDGAERFMNIERARCLADSLAPALLNQRRRDQRVLSAMRPCDCSHRLADRVRAVIAGVRDREDERLGGVDDIAPQPARDPRQRLLGQRPIDSQLLPFRLTQENAGA